MTRRTSIAQRLAIGLVRGYQITLGPFLGGRCRFHPSCSHYAIEAIHTWGALRGCWLALLRILRCQPLCKGGYDPVPSGSGLPASSPPQDPEQPSEDPGQKTNPTVELASGPVHPR